MKPWLNWSGAGWYQELSFSQVSKIWAQVSSNKNATAQAGWRWFSSEGEAKLDLGITQREPVKRGDLY